MHGHLSDAGNLSKGRGYVYKSQWGNGHTFHYLFFCARGGGVSPEGLRAPTKGGDSLRAFLRGSEYVSDHFFYIGGRRKGG